MSRRRPLPVVALLALLLAAAVVANPAVSLAAARQGLHLWWTAVLPGLLPFFILSDLLQATGVVKAFGLLLDPLMRPLFALPGAAAFALVVGFTSGPPSGARAAAQLTSAGLCSPEEGSRLAAFTTVAGPLFVTGVTAVSLFRVPAAAPRLALVHYAAALLVGVLLARLPSARRSLPRTLLRRARRDPWRAAWTELEKAAAAAPPPGQLLASVVRQGVETVLLVAGFIVLFSVLVGLLDGAARSLRLPPGPAAAGLPGLLEVTVGLSRVAAAPAPLADRLTVASVLLAWSGLSIHAQVAAVSAAAGLSYRRFVEARLLHVGLSLLLSQIVWLLAPPLPVASALSPPHPAPGSPSLLWWTAGGLALSLALPIAAGLAAVFLQLTSRHLCAIWVPRSRSRS